MEAPLLQPPVPLPPNHDTTAAVVQPRPASGGVAGAREQCPRCASHDTKFCYYNNYNTAQPRHFCRACRRYWTLGGSLRNVPIGGSTRKRPRPARPSRAAVAAVGAFASPAPPQGGLLGSLISSASPLLALGAGPLLEGRLGFDLGLGLPGPAMDPAGAGEVGLGFGLRGPVAPFLWPTGLLENDHMDPWKVGGPAAVWQELSATTAPAEAGALHLGAQLL